MRMNPPGPGSMAMPRRRRRMASIIVRKRSRPTMAAARRRMTIRNAYHFGKIGDYLPNTMPTIRPPVVLRLRRNVCAETDAAIEHITRVTGNKVMLGVCWGLKMGVENKLNARPPNAFYMPRGPKLRLRAEEGGT